MAMTEKDSHKGPWNFIAAFSSENKELLLITLTVLLLLFPIFLSVYIRSYPATLPITNQWAKSSVYNSVKSQIGNQVAQQYPNLPTANRDQLINEQFALFLKQRNAELEPQIAAAAASFRAQLQDDTGQTYLIAIDPYQFLRRTENIVDHGNPGETLVDGKPFDPYLIAPLGAFASATLHHEVSALLVKIVRIFNPSTSVMAVMFWIPVIFAALAVIPAFFIGHRKGGLIGGLFAATLIGVHAGFVGRTAAGFADTDAYVVLFPLLCGWLFLEAFETKYGNWKRHGILLGLTGLSFGLFAWVWEWWFFFDVLILMLIAYLLYLIVRFLVNRQSLADLLKDDRFRGWLVTFFGLIVSTGLFVTLIVNFETFISGPLQAISRSTGLKAAIVAGSLWPNVFTTVAELNAPSLSGIVSNIGGSVLFIVALMGVLATLIDPDKMLLKDWLLLGGGLLVFIFLLNQGETWTVIQFLAVMILPIAAGGVLLLKDKRPIDVKYALLLIGWLAASVFAMTKGVRFVLLLIPPFAIGAAIAAGTAYKIGKQWLDGLDRNMRLFIAGALLYIFALALILGYLPAGTAKLIVAGGFLVIIPVGIWLLDRSAKDHETFFLRALVGFSLFLAISTLLIQPIQAGNDTGYNEVPSMSDAWWNTLTKIRQDSAPNAIINSWWDFGHWFKYVAHRAVTFDGGSQSTPMAHWIGKVLLTSDEKEALAILRMLDCGSSLGAQDVQDGLPGHDQYEAIMLTKKIIMLPPDEARARLLEAGISAEQADVILSHTHCEPPEDYFITSADMVGKGGVWGHFGSWDFARADAYNNMRHLPQAEAVPLMEKKYNWTESEAQNRYFEMQALTSDDAVNSWIAPWPSYPVSSFSACNYAENGTLVVCDMRLGIGQNQGAQTVIDRLVVDLKSMNKTHLEIGFYDQNGRKLGENNNVFPAEIVVATDKGLGKYQLAGAGFNQAFLLDLRSTPQTMMLDPKNAESMFTRLFFLDGLGTTAFQKFSDEQAFNMGRIKVWKVDWTKLKDDGLV